MRADKWDGWATFVLFLAGLTVLLSGFVVFRYGFVEIPTYGGGARHEINVLVWSIAIGQSLGAILFAGLFCMVRDIYKNSCRGLEISADPLPEIVAPEDFAGLRIDRVHDASPLAGHVRSGYTLLAVNGRPAISEKDAAESLLDGVNTFSLLDANGNEIEKRLKMRPQPLHLRFAQ